MPRCSRTRRAGATSPGGKGPAPEKMADELLHFFLRGVNPHDPGSGA